MITVANRIFVAEEYAEQFEEAFRKRAGLVDGMPGFISNQVLRPVNPGDPYIVLTLWNTRTNFEKRSIRGMTSADDGASALQTRLE